VECILKIVLLFEYVIPPGSPIYSLLSESARDFLHPFRRIDTLHGGWRWYRRSSP